MRRDLATVPREWERWPLEKASAPRGGGRLPGGMERMRRDVGSFPRGMKPFPRGAGRGYPDVTRVKKRPCIASGPLCVIRFINRRKDGDAMAIMPKNMLDRVSFLRAHLAQWQAHAEQIGSSGEEIAAIAAQVDELERQAAVPDRPR